MIPVYVQAYSCFSSVGNEINLQMENIKHGKRGLLFRESSGLYKTYAGFIADVDSSRFIQSESLSRLESLVVCNLQETLKRSGWTEGDEEPELILCTTKGNIDMLRQNFSSQQDGLRLGSMASRISNEIGFKGKPTVISLVCVSGMAGIIYGARKIQSGLSNRVLICGFDELSEFVLRGFACLKAMDEGRCKPFDIGRSGVNLGEAVASVMLGPEIHTNGILVEAGSIRNDANHISGPSRDGEGLFQSITASLSKINSDEIGFISAHGTGTLYNDDMEAVAIYRSGLSHVPVNSFKAFTGHTLGAAGVLESIFCFESFKRNELYSTPGFENGNSEYPLDIIKETRNVEVNKILKLGSGFGGVNAAIVYGRG